MPKPLAITLRVYMTITAAYYSINLESTLKLIIFVNMLRI